jgi:hypothetical protein
VFLLVSCAEVLSQTAIPARSDDFFNQPELLCSALEKNGLHSGPWKAIGLGFADVRPFSGPSPYLCEAPQWVHPPVPTQLPQLPTGGNLDGRRSSSDISVLYRVSGDSAGRADVITIAVTVYQADAMEKGEHELKRNVALLFTAIKLAEPVGLLASIHQHRYFRTRQPFGFVSFNLVKPDRKPNDQVLWFRIWK